MSHINRTPQAVCPGVALFAITIGIHGCAPQATDKPVEHTVRKVPTETEPGAEKTASAMKEEFEQRLKTNLERLDDEMRGLQKRLDDLKDSAKAEWTEKMVELAAKRQAAGARLEEMQKSTGDAWEHLREGARRAWEELEQAMQKARKEF